MANSIFVSYRRFDSQHATFAIADRLRWAFGPDESFSIVAPSRPGTNGRNPEACAPWDPPHHPRWENQWKVVNVFFSTWNVDCRVTKLDIDAARQAGQSVPQLEVAFVEWPPLEATPRHRPASEPFQRTKQTLNTLFIPRTVYRSAAHEESAHRAIADTVCSHEGTAARWARPAVDPIAQAATTTMQDGASTDRGPCCHDARVCPAGAFALRRRVGHATCVRDQRPLCLRLKPDI
jgi:hypothetical protein